MKILYTALLSLLLPLNAKSQHVVFPLDTNTVTIDGVLQPLEWGNAETIMINVNTADNVQVMFKHDGNAMYFAYTGKLESANALFPEVLTDAAHMGGSSWVNGQWWLHVSATDCENNGGYGVYTNCLATQPGWEGAPNFSAGPPMTDTVEIKIPFSKVGFNPATMDTMGMAFMVTNTANIFRLYPTGADRNVPATWADATFSKEHVSIAHQGIQSSISIYPNPACDVVCVKGAEQGSSVYLRDITGRLLQERIVFSSTEILPVSEYPAGMYIVEVKLSGAASYTQRFCKQ